MQAPISACIFLLIVKVLLFSRGHFLCLKPSVSARPGQPSLVLKGFYGAMLRRNNTSAAGPIKGAIISFKPVRKPSAKEIIFSSPYKLFVYFQGFISNVGSKPTGRGIMR